MSQPPVPLAEVFGHMITDRSQAATRCRRHKLCPFNNNVPNCTKDKARDPLGVCSVYSDGRPVITCPVRFREEWLITDDAASFFFPSGTSWSSLTEVRLPEANAKSAGNIDVVLVAYDKEGRVTDFGALEVQAVYISGNVRDPFEYFMKNQEKASGMDWSSQPNYPRPDYLSSSRKRLAPQLLFKGGILKQWGKKTAVAIGRSFFETLPRLKSVPEEKADIAWLVYDLKLPNDSAADKVFRLTKVDQVFTEFGDALRSITTSSPGNLDNFIRHLQERLDEKLEAPPENKTIESPF